MGWGTTHIIYAGKTKQHNPVMHIMAGKPTNFCRLVSKESNPQSFHIEWIRIITRKTSAYNTIHRDHNESWRLSWDSSAYKNRNKGGKKHQFATVAYSVKGKERNNGFQNLLWLNIVVFLMQLSSKLESKLRVDENKIIQVTFLHSHTLLLIYSGKIKSNDETADAFIRVLKVESLESSIVLLSWVEGHLWLQWCTTWTNRTWVPLRLFMWGSVNITVSLVWNWESAGDRFRHATDQPVRLLRNCVRGQYTSMKNQIL